MKNNWSNKEAAKYIKFYKRLGYSKDIALRVYTTKLLGKNKELVLHGGGNTSVKTLAKDIDGKVKKVLCIKGSGWNMAEIEPEGLPAVKLEPLLTLKGKDFMSDEDMVAFQKRNLIKLNSPNPSVETFVHAFLPYKYVDHTHSDAIVSITNRPNNAKLCKEFFGSKAEIVPYVMPGFKLAKKVNDIYSKNPNIECLILLNHGIFTFNNDAKRSYELMIKYVSVAERLIRAFKKKKIRKIDYNFNNLNPREISPILRGMISNNEKSKFIVNFRSNQIIKNFINSKNLKKYTDYKMATPDHVIRIKPFPLIIETNSIRSIQEFKKLAKKKFLEYKKKYKNYFQENQKKSDEKKIMLDTSPRLIFVKNVGLFSVGESYESSIIAGDLAETNAKVITSVEETSSYKFISKKDLFDIEYWSLEQAKIKKTQKRLQGNVVVITGGLGTIGFETYKIFKKYGAEVVLVDNNLKKIREFQNSCNDPCLYCDVRNKKSVENLFNIVIKKFGGVDILVSNAGSSISGSIGEVKDVDLRRSFEINFFSHQNCASEAVKIMKKQNTGGCLLFNISKQAVNPGKNFGPYGLPKSALLSLCKQYAIDYGSFGIRSNGINADRIRSSLLNNKMIKLRSEARGVTEEEYMKGNLLQQEVKAQDVAEAFYSLAVSKKTTGSIFTVDGGNIAASLR